MVESEKVPVAVNWKGQTDEAPGFTGVTAMDEAGGGYGERA